MRRVAVVPEDTCFKPVGKPMRELEEVVLSLYELEALRLADGLGLYQEEAAERMHVSRATFARIIKNARRKTADALIQGKALRIEGGPALHQPDTDPSDEKPMSTSHSHTKESQRPMKIAISVKGNDLSSPLNPQYGRALNFLLIDENTNEVSVLYNEESANLSHGAGVRTTQRLARCGVSVVITGRTGPKATSALQTANIDVYYSRDKTAAEALDRYRKNELDNQPPARKGGSPP